MAVCDTCGNEYAGAFQVVMGKRTYTFDSFECAIAKVAPTCAQCRCRVIGHGIEGNGIIYCCAHCAKDHGVTNVVDNSAHGSAMK